ncbi:hypothetical protein [Streptomyces sp. NPDC046821]|uniref:hypothetical protein n=1 Tax=Streptomyces sp. NPDC046821 TaxID=3154702 RepID=UPI00340057E0
MKTQQTISIEIDTDRLASHPDSHLAMLWHVAQANPALHGDVAAGEIVRHVGSEIIRRWLKAAPAEMYHHQDRHHYWSNLSRFASWDVVRQEWTLNEEKVAKLREDGEPHGDSH